MNAERRTSNTEHRNPNTQHPTPLALRRAGPCASGLGAAALCCILFARWSSAAFVIESRGIEWQQASGQKSFWAFVEREELSSLDRVSRMVFAVQVGRGGPKLETLSVRWKVSQGAAVVAEATAPLDKGLLDVRFSLAGLKPGRYDVAAELFQAGKPTDKSATFFRIVETSPPPQKGRVPLVLPRGVPLKEGTWPIICGVPFPKGALWNKDHVRVVTADGKPVPVQTIARSRWGHTDETSIRWLGLDFQASQAGAYWPDRKAQPYFLEYGPDVKPAAPQPSVRVQQTPDGIRVDTGPLQFLVRRQGFNLLDDARLNGKPVLNATAKDGLYLIDHEGSVYRAANDAETTLAVEEAGDLRVVLRAEGWYVKDGTQGKTTSWTLPTDRLCKFITRIEAYAGKPYVRALNTWILTFDSNTVRLRDVGFSLPVRGIASAEFGVEGGAPVAQTVGAQGVYLIQHKPDAFSIEDGAGKELANGKRSAGWVSATAADAVVTVGHRETWQRFPKEFEALPDALRFHVWPAHGRRHPEIDELKHEEIHKLWFAHQGRELNMAQPWSYYFAVSRIWDKPSQGVYDGPGLALAGTYSSAMGAAITSDTLIQFAPKDAAAGERGIAACFQTAPHALPDPKWLCDSRALGYLHPYDPENFKTAEETVETMLRGYAETQDFTGEYGMWIYRVWHHVTYDGDGKWQLYRLYNTTHHYDAFMPWMLYARSGDPFYLAQGSANIRQMTDVQTIHYDDPSYPHKEFHFGQGRLVGSQRHTNGFNTWGGDHAILAHLTCYNAVIAAHYLTGDLRLREVVVDEWQKTVLNDRLHPQYGGADRSGNYGRDGARDVTNALGELMDLYQMTYRPEILALMAPALDFMLNQHLRMWGQPLHNTILFYGSEKAKKIITDAVVERRATAGKGEDPHSVWFTHAPHEILAMASIAAPESKAHVDAWLACNFANMLIKARDIRAMKPKAIAFCRVPDFILYVPRVLYSVANAGGDLSLGQLSAAQPLPIAVHHYKGWAGAIVREDADREIAVNFIGKVSVPFPVKVYAPDGAVVAEAEVPVGAHAPFRVTIPKDGKTGEYVIFSKPQDAKCDLMAPLTDLPEVYYVNYWSQHANSRFFTRSRGPQPEAAKIRAHAGLVDVLSLDGETQIAASKERGDTVEFSLGPQGAWLLVVSRYVHPPTPFLLSVGPDRWFAPSQESLKRQP